jgi:sec-independent protein translocase protein TatC
MPLVIQFSLGQQQKADGASTVAILLLPKVSEYLSLVMNLILAFGFCFQLPVLLSVLARAGFLTSTQLCSFRKYALILAFTVAAVITPPDVLSQCALAIPTYLLYELSIFAIRLSEKRRS